MANITKLEELKVDKIEVKNTEDYNGSTTEGTVTLKLDRISGECWGGYSWDLLFPRIGSEQGNNVIVTPQYLADKVYITEPYLMTSIFSKTNNGLGLPCEQYGAKIYLEMYSAPYRYILKDDGPGGEYTFAFEDDQIQTGVYGGTVATREWVNAQNFGGGGSIDTSNLLEWDPEDRYIYDLGLGSWTTGATTWYEDEEHGDNTALQYVRIEPKYIDPPSEDEDTHMFIGVYSNEYSSGLNPYNGLFINQGNLTTTNYGYSSIKTKTNNFNSGVYEDLVLQFPTYDVTNLDDDAIGRTETIATREWVQSNVTGGATKIYASKSGTTEVSILRIYTDSSGYLHIKTS